MYEITREVVIDAPRQVVWEALADFGNVQVMNPNITNSTLTSEQESGVGTTRHCDLALMGASLKERIVGWEEGRQLDIDIYEWEKLPGLKSQAARFTLEDEGEGTRLRGTASYSLKFGPLGALMNSMMFNPRFSKGWEIFLAGIKHYAETGESTDGVRLDVAPVMAPA